MPNFISKKNLTVSNGEGKGEGALFKTFVREVRRVFMMMHKGLGLIIDTPNTFSAFVVLCKFWEYQISLGRANLESYTRRIVS